MNHPGWENWIVGLAVIFLSARGIIGYAEDLIGIIRRRIAKGKS